MGPQRRPVLVPCDLARQAVSARLDDEGLTMAGSAVDDHLASCSSCRGYLVAATALRRRFSLREPRRPPSLVVEALVLAGPAPGSRPSLLRRRRIGRAGVARLRFVSTLVAVVAAAVAIPIGASAHARILPTGARTPCTAGLHRPPPRG
jgi:predicted anti-sigma-YlaC factor YlaD